MQQDATAKRYAQFALCGAFAVQYVLCAVKCCASSTWCTVVLMRAASANGLDCVQWLALTLR